MNTSVKYMRDRLTLSYRLNNKLMRNKGHPQEFILFENLLWNLFGPPLIRLERSRWSPSGMFWKKDIDGRWARVRNEFFFKDERTAMLARLHMPADYEVTKKLI